ncbi:MAG: hypothetical protein CVU63_12850, partial [Deltaproteobacteria bacterium HGW-Deltaproteobacteria-20]
MGGNEPNPVGAWDGGGAGGIPSGNKPPDAWGGGVPNRSSAEASIGGGDLIGVGSCWPSSIEVGRLLVGSAVAGMPLALGAALAAP